MLTIEKPKETLDFQIEGSGTIYSIPYAKDLPLAYIDVMTAIANDGTGKEAFNFLHKVMDQYAPGAWEELTQAGLALILEAWGEGLGESSPRRP